MRANKLISRKRRSFSLVKPSHASDLCFWDVSTDTGGDAQAVSACLRAPKAARIQSDNLIRTIRSASTLQFLERTLLLPSLFLSFFLSLTLSLSCAPSWTPLSTSSSFRGITQCEEKHGGSRDLYLPSDSSYCGLAFVFRQFENSSSERLSVFPFRIANRLTFARGNFAVEKLDVKSAEESVAKN